MFLQLSYPFQSLGELRDEEEDNEEEAARWAKLEGDQDDYLMFEYETPLTGINPIVVFAEAAHMATTRYA